MAVHFSGCKRICHLASQSSWAKMSAWRSEEPVSFLMWRYRRQSSANRLASDIFTTSGRSLMKAKIIVVPVLFLGNSRVLLSERISEACLGYFGIRDIDPFYSGILGLILILGYLHIILGIRDIELKALEQVKCPKTPFLNKWLPMFIFLKSPQRRIQDMI